jgi:hypothetical protein
MKMEYKRHKVITIISFGMAVVLYGALMVIPGVQRAIGDIAVVREEQDYIQPPVPNGNNALQFDGVNDYVEIPEIAAIRTDEKEPLTVEFWVFIASRPDNWQKVVSKWGARGGDDDEFVVCLRQNGTFGFADTGRTGLDSMTTFPTNIWSHFCCVWDSANQKYTLYLNGERIPQSLKGGAALRLTGEQIRIGTDGHRNQCFCGIIDEVRFWSVARSQAEIKRDMYRKLRGDEPGLKGYWNFDEGQGQIVHDLSESGNRGRLGRLPFSDDCDPKWVASGLELIEPQ